MTFQARLAGWWGKVPPWAWLVGLAAGLRLVNLGAENLWYDEAFTAFLTKLGPVHLYLNGLIKTPTELPDLPQIAWSSAFQE